MNISVTEPDWSRERKSFFSWQPSRSLLDSIRQYQKYAKSRNPIFILLRKVAVLRHGFWSVITGADIPVNTRLGGGLLLIHPNGIVIHPDAVVGVNCLIFQQVTIGTRNGSAPPVIGGHVDIGSGAKILGDIRIGDHVVVGANAAVITDVPDNCLAVGVPAVVKARASKALDS
jgi:serine O-acetyltransferase